jgi:uncharacterized cofD-like protein
MSSTNPEITVIGGGTGSFTLLRDLKNLTPNLSAVVNMSDDGGSTGVLKDELGVLPMGDIRQCLVALSDNPEVRDIFSYRFADGGLGGHSLGNIILSGLELQYGSFNDAVRIASKLLNIQGRVIPATLQSHTLVMEDGAETIRGEFVIGHRPIANNQAWLRLDPPSNINPEASDAIVDADLVVLAPGNLFGSLLPILAIDGMATAIAESKAKKVVVSNLVTKPGQTDGWHVVDYVKQFERYIGENTIDIVLYNSSPPPLDLLSKYAAEGEYPVTTGSDRFREIAASCVGRCLLAQSVYGQEINDKTIRRTLIRHDGAEVSRQLMSLLS